MSSVAPETRTYELTTMATFKSFSHVLLITGDPVAAVVIMSNYASEAKGTITYELGVPRFSLQLPGFSRYMAAY